MRDRRTHACFHSCVGNAGQAIVVRLCVVDVGVMAATNNLDQLLVATAKRDVTGRGIVDGRCGKIRIRRGPLIREAPLRDGRRVHGYACQEQTG